MDIPAKSVIPHAVVAASRRLSSPWGRACAALLCAAGALAATAFAAETALLTNPAAAIGDELGFTLDADGGFVVSGSPGEGAGTGAAYVFDCTDTPCAAPQRVVAGDLAEGDQFGAAIALAGDTLVVGATGQVPGAAYVFVRSGGGWTQQARLLATGGVAGDRFGNAVALDGDRLVVAADRADGRAGAVYVFRRSGTVWTQEARLVASDAAAGNGFGRALALDADTLVVGAPLEAGAAIGGFARGAAYAFVRSGTGWSQQAKLAASMPADGDMFGLALALDGERALIGAPMSDNRLGSAYLFARAAGLWSQQVRLAPVGGLAGDRFGWSVAFAGDAALAGAPYAFEGCGSATVFRHSAGTWHATSEAAISVPLPGILAGWTVAGDGARFVVGAPGHAGELEHRGAAYLFGGGDAIFGDGFEPSALALACAEK